MLLENQLLFELMNTVYLNNLEARNMYHYFWKEVAGWNAVHVQSL